MSLHPNIRHLEFLLGTWRGSGRGYYPTIDDFSYTETLTFAATPGKPFLRYEQKTAGPAGPMHTEVGYLRPAGEEGVEFVIAQPTGQTELLEGRIVAEGEALSLVFAPSSVHNTSTAKQVQVTRRSYIFSADRREVSTRFDMGAAGQLAQQHLESSLTREG